MSCSHLQGENNDLQQSAFCTHQKFITCLHSCWEFEKMLTGSAFYKVICITDIQIVDFFHFTGVESKVYVNDSTSNKCVWVRNQSYI